MRSPLLLAVVLGVLCRRGHPSSTIVPTTAKATTLGATTPKTLTSGGTKAGSSPTTSVSATSEKQTTLQATTPSLKPTQSIAPTVASIQKTTLKDGHPGTSNSPAPSGGSPAKPASPAPTASAATTTRPVAPPTTSPTARLSLQATTPPSPASTKPVASTSPAQKTSERITGKATTSSATSQGTSTTAQGSRPVGQSSAVPTGGQTVGSTARSMAQTTPRTEQTPAPDATQPATSAKPAGTPGTTADRSTEAGSRPTPLGPGVSVLTTGHPPQHSPRPSSQGNRTWPLNQSQLLCEEEIPETSQDIMLTFNQSTPCDSLIKSALEEPLLNMICRALKPNFNRSRDHCLVRLAPIASSPNTLAIVGVSVQINSVADELFESLKIKEGELKKLGMNVSYAGQYADIDSEDRFSMPLIITIVCMAASLLLVAAIYGCCHQRISQRKDQQRLTEELQTMENGYHDNPTLEVMETSSEMQEKKVNPNGELGDSWIVPLDNLTKEDLGEEEDTHL